VVCIVSDGRSQDTQYHRCDGMLPRRRRENQDRMSRHTSTSTLPKSPSLPHSKSRNRTRDPSSNPTCASFLVWELCQDPRQYTISGKRLRSTPIGGACGEIVALEDNYGTHKMSNVLSTAFPHKPPSSRGLSLHIGTLRYRMTSRSTLQVLFGSWFQRGDVPGFCTTSSLRM
jgi:hypothetical protein